MNYEKNLVGSYTAYFRAKFEICNVDARKADDQNMRILRINGIERLLFGLSDFFSR